jgi:hypothetical protein
MLGTAVWSTITKYDTMIENWENNVETESTIIFIILCILMFFGFIWGIYKIIILVRGVATIEPKKLTNIENTMSKKKVYNYMLICGMLLCGYFEIMLIFEFIRDYNGLTEALKNDGETRGYSMGIILSCLFFFGFVWCLYKIVVLIKGGATVETIEADKQRK